MIVLCFRWIRFMPTIFEKLNLKNQDPIVVLNAPRTFDGELAGLSRTTVVRKLVGLKELEFCLAFVITQKEVDTLSAAVAKLAQGDAVVWFAYPKGTSKRYKSEITRDSGWQVMGKAGFEPVRMVAIDEDWSAFRFRRVEFIKQLTRSRTISEMGKAKRT